MIFKSVSLKNFYKYGMNEQTLNLDEDGIRLVTADNGEGKSSIFYAIVWCLYGKTLQDTVDDVVNRRTRKNCKVSVEFVEDGILYKIIRYRKHEEHENNLYIFKGDRDISLRKAQDTQQLILDVIKMPYQAFISSTFFSTELYKEFLRAKTSERLTTFESLLSLKEVNMFYDIAKNFHTGIKDKLEELNLKRSIKISEKETLDRMTKEYVVKAKNLLLGLKEKKEKSSSELLDLEKKLNEYSTIDIKKELENIDNGKRIKSIEKDIEGKKTYLKIFDPSKYYTEKDIVYYKKFEGIDLKAELDIQNIIRNTLHKIEILNNGISGNNSEIRRLKYDISIEEKVVKNREDTLVQLGIDLEKINSNICSSCGQHIEETFAISKRKEIQENIDEATGTIKNSNTNIENSSILLKEQETEKKEREDEIKSLVAPAQNEIIGSEAIDIIIERMKSIKSNIDLSKKEEDEINVNNEKVEKEISLLKEELIKYKYEPKYTEDFINNLKENISKVEKEISELKNIIAGLDGQASTIYDKSYVEENKVKIIMALQDISSLELQENSLKEDDKYYQCLMECFSNREESFKKFFIGTMIDTFNDKINQYLPFFFEENLVIKFDKDLTEDIEMDGDLISFSSLSTGQKAKAEISVAFALFDLSRIFFSSETNLLIIDEMLDRGIDQRGIESALSIIEGMAEGIGIFVVSHKSDLKDNIKNKIEIKRDENNFSLIK